MLSVFNQLYEIDPLLPATTLPQILRVFEPILDNFDNRFRVKLTQKWVKTGLEIRVNSDPGPFYRVYHEFKVLSTHLSRPRPNLCSISSLKKTVFQQCTNQRRRCMGKPAIIVSQTVSQVAIQPCHGCQHESSGPGIMNDSFFKS